MIRAIWSIRSNLIPDPWFSTADIGQMDCTDPNTLISSSQHNADSSTDPNTFISPTPYNADPSISGCRRIHVSIIQCTATWYNTCIIRCTWYMILYQIGFHASMPHMLQLTPDNICRTAAAVRIKDLTKQHFVMWGGFRHILLQLLSLFVSMSRKSQFFNALF